MVCRNCSKEVNDEYKFCPYCGRVFSYKEKSNFANRSFLKKILSPSGKVGRLPYSIAVLFFWISYITIIVLNFGINVIEKGEEALVSPTKTQGLFSLFLPIIAWVLLVQGAKRCHDLERNGWWQFVPFFFFVMIFKKGKNP